MNVICLTCARGTPQFRVHETSIALDGIICDLVPCEKIQPRVNCKAYLPYKTPKTDVTK